jgi:hypothetical protein
MWGEVEWWRRRRRRRRWRGGIKPSLERGNALTIKATTL